MYYIDSKGKYLTKKLLIEANNAAIREERNGQLKEEYLESLPDNKVYPIILALDEHNRGEIRVQILFDEKKTMGFLDLSKNRYNLLPNAIFNEDGTVELVSEEELTEKRLYPPGREYVEKVVRKVIRDKDFRTRVLTAYNNQCVMCKINDISVLVAAHIYPAHLCSDDTVNNGICLCSNHDKAYEKGNILVKSNTEIVLRKSANTKVSYNKIRLPINKADYPSSERLNQRLELSLKSKKSNVTPTSLYDYIE